LDFRTFENWLSKLSDADQAYLGRHSDWQKEFQKIRKTGVLPKGFAEKTMEILEDGSESET